MSDAVQTLAGVPVLVCARDGAALGTERDATDVIAKAWGARAKLVALPAVRLVPDFFVLRRGLAGAFLQKFVTYEMGVAIVGDIEAHLAASKPLRDFVYETNRGTQVWFVPDLEALTEKIGAGTTRRSPEIG
jgi:hypothetical protein